MHWRLPFLLFALLAFGLGFVACGEGGGDDEARQMIESAGFKGVESGRFEVSLAIDSNGSRNGNLDVHLAGQVQRGGGNVPQAKVDASVEGDLEGRAISFTGGLTLFPDHGFIDYQGSDYEIEPSNFTFAKSIFLRDGSGVEGTTNGIAKCRQLAAEMGAGDLIDDPRDEGTVKVDGTATTKISGELDVQATVEALSELARDPDCRGQMEAVVPVPLAELWQNGDEFAAATEQARFAVYVDREDVIRKLEAELTGKSDDGGQVEVDLEFVLSEVNEPQEIEAPAKAQPLPTWFGRLGIDQFQFITLATGGEVVAYLLEKIRADALP